jgi:hypothetical protein
MRVSGFCKIMVMMRVVVWMVMVVVVMVAAVMVQGQFQTPMLYVAG